MGLLEDLKSIFYSRKLTCSVCRRENFSDRTVCDECFATLPFNGESICGHCGRATPYPAEYCDYCKNKESFIDLARSVYDYEQPIKGLIHRFKYDGEKYLAEEFALEMNKIFTKSMGFVDCVAFVPSTDKKLKERGYNQSRVLAEEFSKLTEIPLIDAVQKIKETESQVGLSVKERKENLKGCFKVVEKAEVKGKTVLIVDDVMTTGSTLETLAEKLKKAGAIKVLALTVASVSFNKNKGEEQGEKTPKTEKMNENL
ncbi:MAG: ComF family protein [Clostridia bacterium]|nr:ComF family protein [Clostridia bacterium]